MCTNAVDSRFDFLAHNVEKALISVLFSGNTTAFPYTMLTISNMSELRALFLPNLVF